MNTRSTLLLLTLLSLSGMAGIAQTQVPKSMPYATPDGVIGWLEYKPADYGSQKHPLIVFLHGIGERGNGTTQIQSITANGIANYCAHGASMRFTVNGVTSSFVVLSPQLSTQYGSWPSFYVKELIKYAKANLSIDTNRIYVTGLSLGGGGVWNAITDAPGGDYSFDAGIAAAAPVCGTQEEQDANFVQTIGNNHLPIWAFHSMDDGTVNVGATQHADLLGQMNHISPAMKVTYYQTGGHSGCWINAYDTGHITRTLSDGSSFTANPNLYEWFLSKSRAVLPVADAGAPQIVNSNSTTLSAAGSYSPNGLITSYNWTQVSGPIAATISNNGTMSPLVTNLQSGAYQFQLTVTDVVGASGSAITSVTVNALLPVTYTYFRAQAGNSGNLLQWETSAEENNDYYSIERSTDGKQFAAIGKINGAGSTGIVHDYSYTDAQPANGTNYYRLKQVDKNGSAAYSSVVLVNAGLRTQGMQVFSNPVKENLVLSLANNVKGNGKLTIYELNGRAVRQQNLFKSEQVMNISLNMNGLSAGMYIVDMSVGEQYHETKRIMKE